MLAHLLYLLLGLLTFAVLLAFTLGVERLERRD
jgi:hypothetical protein